MDYDFSINYRLVSHKYNWTFTPIWKNATASILKSFSDQYKNLPQFHTNHQIHAFLFSGKFKNNEELSFLHKDSDKYLKFVKTSNNIVCVRDPYERFISGFYHKVLLNPEGKEARSFMKHNNINSLSNIEILERFVAYVKAGKDIDPHFFSQTELANLNDISYKHVIDFKNLNSEWNLLRNQYPNIPAMVNEKLHKTNSNQFGNSVRNNKKNSRIVKQIEMLYLDDYIFLRNNNK